MRLLTETCLALVFIFIFSHCSPKVQPVYQMIKTEESKKEQLAQIPELPPEAFGFSQQKYYVAKDSSAAYFQKEADWKQAKEVYEAFPNLQNTIWYGRRTAYLKHYKKAIHIYTKGIQQHSNSAELYRHRGHCYISTRQLDKAIVDFQQAAKLVKNRNIEVEKNGTPNARNIPLSNLQFNIYYHWAFAHYLKQDFATALELYKKCMDYSINSDLIVATSDWLYMTYRRLGTDEKTAQWEALRFVNENMTIVENQNYHQRCLMYKGLRETTDLLPFQIVYKPDLDLIIKGYGVANWYFYNGNEEKADHIYRQILKTEKWDAFEYIAAEMDLARLQKNEE